MLPTQPSKMWLTWSGRGPPGKLFFQGDKVEEPITPLETPPRINFMMHDRSQLSGRQGRILEGYRLISIFRESVGKKPWQCTPQIIIFYLPCLLKLFRNDAPLFFPFAKQWISKDIPSYGSQSKRYQHVAKYNCLPRKFTDASWYYVI